MGSHSDHVTMGAEQLLNTCRSVLTHVPDISTPLTVAGIQAQFKALGMGDKQSRGAAGRVLLTLADDVLHVAVDGGKTPEEQWMQLVEASGLGFPPSDHSL